MNKYYAVKCGRKTGVFIDWSSCEKQVKGFPNAAFKSFKNLNEAKAYLENSTSVDLDGSNKIGRHSGDQFYQIFTLKNYNFST